jgi:hypothetical protein
MVVFGGIGGGYRNDVWALSLGGGTSWTQLFPSGTLPTARYEHCAAFDSYRRRMLIFGGAYGTYQLLNDAQALSLSGSPAWTQLSPAGGPPAARYLGATVYDSRNDRMLAHGGFQIGTSTYYVMSDLWSLWLPGVVGVGPARPSGAARLELPRPNPARGRVEASFTLPRAARASLRVLGVSGRAVAVLVDADLPAGEHHAAWNGRTMAGSRAPAGVYVLELRADGATASRRVTLIR